MAFAAAIGPIISGIASLAGAAISFAASSSQASAEEEIAAQNAAELRKKAAWEQSRGAAESHAKSREYDTKVATARAAMAQGGISTTEGTPLLLQQQFASDKWYDTSIIMANARNQQRTDMAKADIVAYEGQMRANATRSQGMAGLLSGFASGIKSFGGAFG